MEVQDLRGWEEGRYAKKAGRSMLEMLGSSLIERVGYLLG